MQLSGLKHTSSDITIYLGTLSVILYKTEFGSDDHRTAITELSALKQTGIVEEYTTQFQSLQFDINMHSCQ